MNWNKSECHWMVVGERIESIVTYKSVGIYGFCERNETLIFAIVAAVIRQTQSLMCLRLWLRVAIFRTWFFDFSSDCLSRRHTPFAGKLIGPAHIFYDSQTEAPFFSSALVGDNGWHYLQNAYTRTRRNRRNFCCFLPSVFAPDDFVSVDVRVECVAALVAVVCRSDVSIGCNVLLLCVLRICQHVFQIWTESDRVKTEDGRDKSKWKRKPFFFCINKHFSKRWARTDNYEVTTNSWMMSPQRKYRYYVEREPHREYFDTTTNFDTNMCVCDCWPYKGIAYNSHCHMHGERAQPKEWHSIPAYDLFFRSLRSCRWFCVIMDSCRRWHAKK